MRGVGTMRMRSVLDEQLDELHRNLIELGVLVSRSIENAIQAFNENDKELGKRVVDEDKRINKKQHAIDERSQQLIAMQQPNARDLRRIIAVIRAASDLERMGDHAKNIADVLRFVNEDERNGTPEELINQMAVAVLEMTQNIIDAFVGFDVTRAIEVAARDREVDKLYNELRYETVQRMKKSPEIIETASQYSFIGMDLERIGDYVKNIAEELVYLDTGEIIDLN